MARNVYYPYDFEAHKNLSQAISVYYFMDGALGIPSPVNGTQTRDLRTAWSEFRPGPGASSKSRCECETQIGKRHNGFGTKTSFTSFYRKYTIKRLHKRPQKYLQSPGIPR